MSAARATDALQAIVLSGADPTNVMPLHARADRPRAAQDDDEADLIARAKARDPSAWAALYRRHHAPLFRHVLHLVGRSNIAEDLTQEAFARALVSLASFSARSSLSTWLHGIALNLVRTEYRSGERASRAQSQLAHQLAASATDCAGPERDLAQSHRTSLLYAMLDKLTPALREAFVLRYVEGSSANEAAEVLGIEPGAVRVRAHRAREQIEAMLAELHDDVAGGGR
jgi:RNA polymerase sigma-70 factor (ECF subfamily)